MPALEELYQKMLAHDSTQQFEDIVDIIHVSQYVWRGAKVLYHHREQQEAFVEDRLLRILQGDVVGVVWHHKAPQHDNRAFLPASKSPESNQAINLILVRCISSRRRANTRTSPGSQSKNRQKLSMNLEFVVFGSRLLARFWRACLDIPRRRPI